MYSWFHIIQQLWNATVWYPTSNLYFPVAFPIYQALQDIFPAAGDTKTQYIHPKWGKK